MSSNSSRALGAVSNNSRSISRSGGGGGGYRSSQPQPQQHQQNRGGGYSRGRDTRPRRRGNQRGRSDGSIQLPQTPEEWEDKLEGEASQAFMDFSLAFVGSGIPYLPAIALRLHNAGAVAGQEIHALMLAALRSMRLGRVCHPDGTIGRRILREVIEDEFARIEAGG